MKYFFSCLLLVRTNSLQVACHKNACFQTRSITIREPNGRLRKATWEERDRMNLIYFPKPGRKHEMPALLKDTELKVKHVHIS